MFPSEGGFIGILYEVKKPEDSSSSIISKGAFQEIKDFYDQIFTIKYPSTNEKGDITWDNICVKVGAPG